MCKSRTKWFAAIVCAATFGFTQSASSTMIIDFEFSTPFTSAGGTGGGTVVGDRAHTGTNSLYIGPGNQSVFNIPSNMLNGTVTVSMMVFDQGLYIDPNVTGRPSNVRDGAKWGVSALDTNASHTGADYTGVSINHATYMTSGTHYSYNGADARWGAWNTFSSWSPRQVISLGDGGSNPLLPEEEWADPEVPQYAGWQPPQPGVGDWTKWTFTIDPDGSTTIMRERGASTSTRNVAMSGGVKQIWFDGGATSGTGASLAGIWIDDITIVPEPTSLALIGVGGLMLLRRRRA